MVNTILLQLVEPGLLHGLPEAVKSPSISGGIQWIAPIPHRSGPVLLLVVFLSIVLHLVLVLIAYPVFAFVLLD